MRQTKSDHSNESPRGDSPTTMPQKSEGTIGVYLIDTAWRVAVPLLGFTFLGFWLDGRLETDPVLTLVGLFLGVAGSVLAMQRLLAEHFPETLDMIKGKDPETKK